MIETTMSRPLAALSPDLLYVIMREPLEESLVHGRLYRSLARALEAYGAGPVGRSGNSA